MPDMDPELEDAAARCRAALGLPVGVAAPLGRAEGHGTLLARPLAPSVRARAPEAPARPREGASTDADRQRLRRQRARTGRRVVAVELGPEGEDVLLRAGVLGEWDADDRAEVGRAIERLLETLAAADRHV